MNKRIKKKLLKRRLAAQQASQPIPPCVDQIIRENMDLIHTFAAQAHKKLHRPTRYTISDLRQDGVLKALSILREGKWDPDRGPIRALLCVALKNFYRNIIDKSYRSNSHMCKVWLYRPDGVMQDEQGFEERPAGEEDESFQYYLNPSDFFLTISEFTAREQQYIREFLFPTLEDPGQYRRNTQKFRVDLRNHLNMSTYEEKLIRERLIAVLLGDQDADH